MLANSGDFLPIKGEGDSASGLQNHKNDKPPPSQRASPRAVLALRVHLDRVTRRHRDHCHSGGDVVAGPFPSQRQRPGDRLFQQHQAVGDGVGTVRR